MMPGRLVALNVVASHDLGDQSIRALVLLLACGPKAGLHFTFLTGGIAATVCYSESEL